MGQSKNCVIGSLFDIVLKDNIPYCSLSAFSHCPL